MGQPGGSPEAPGSVICCLCRQLLWRALGKVVAGEDMALVCTGCPREWEGCRKVLWSLCISQSCLKCCGCSDQRAGFACVCFGVRQAVSPVPDSIRNLGEARIKQSARLRCRGKEVTAFGGVGMVQPFSSSQLGTGCPPLPYSQHIWPG